MPPLRRFPGSLRFELSEPPEGIALVGEARHDVAERMVSIVLHCDSAKAAPGLRGNLIVNLVAERIPKSAEGQPRPNPRSVVLGTLPALAFEIVQPWARRRPRSLLSRPSSAVPALG